jgi:hypothetical protein
VRCKSKVCFAPVLSKAANEFERRGRDELQGVRVVMIERLVAAIIQPEVPRARLSP